MNYLDLLKRVKTISRKFSFDHSYYTLSTLFLKKKAKPKPKPKRKPAKKKPAKKKVKKKNVGSDDDSEDSDFETSARKKRHMPKPEGEDKPAAERKTRGVVINTTFADEDWRGGKEYSDDDSF